jgi:hypothetical protein
MRTSMARLAASHGITYAPSTFGWEKWYRATASEPE